MMRLGLCCAFRDEPIKFVTTTATSLARLPKHQARAKLSRLCLANADALDQAVRYCSGSGIGAFRIPSFILPLRTHPEVGYSPQDLPDGDEIVRRFRACGEFARAAGVRTGFHPDQFVVLNSPRPEVVGSSLQEIESQAEVASWVNADFVNIHGGGAYGDKRRALDDFARNLARLSPRARSVLTVENDDRTYTPADLLPLCRAEGLPLVYDVHHHRCHRDGLDEIEATCQAAGTWDREPVLHVSSPLEGWSGPKPERHHDFIDPRDVPSDWLGRKLTVEVEAKAKEAAVLRLRSALLSKAAP